MTVTRIEVHVVDFGPERTELPVEDLAIECDMENCSNKATLAVHLVHGCIRLSCGKCLAEVLGLIIFAAPIRLTCGGCEMNVLTHVKSDFIKSITPL